MFLLSEKNVVTETTSASVPKRIRFCLNENLFIFSEEEK